MARKRTTGFTDREAEILSILWDLGEASVEDIRRRLSGNPTASTVIGPFVVAISTSRIASLSRSSTPFSNGRLPQGSQ